MKPYRILVFTLLSFFCLGTLGYVFPKEGVKIGETLLMFPSPSSIFEEKGNEDLDIEKKIEELKEQTDISKMQSVADSFLFLREFITNNKARLYFPNNDYTYFDPLFARLEKAENASNALHILHYGDSQIEMDRITSIFRQRLQETFSGEGAGIVPAIQTIPSVTVRQSYSGSLARYVVYGDTSQKRASHRRYGLLANVSQLNGNAVVTVGESTYKQAQENTKRFSRLVLLVGNHSALTATCRSQTRSVAENLKNVSVMAWNFDTPVSRASIDLHGKAEIYGISMEGKSGIAVDNIPLRGCSGTIFTRIDSLTLAQCYKKMNVCMIILQFGGNMMPMINSQNAIDNYMVSITKQIKYIKHLAPDAFILFIGPSDMSKRVNGMMQTYPYLPALNEALKETVMKNKGAYWDMFNVMGGQNSMLSWVKHVPAWAGSDYIHFTETGANQIASFLSDAFMTHYYFYNMRKTLDPAFLERFMGKK